MLVFTVKRGEWIDFELPDGSKGRITIGKGTRANRIQLACAMPRNVRLIRSSAVPVDAIPALASFKPCPNADDGGDCFAMSPELCDQLRKHEALQEA